MNKTLIFVISFILLAVLSPLLLLFCGGNNNQNEVDTQAEVSQNSAVSNESIELDTLSIRNEQEEKDAIDKAAATIIEMVTNRDKKGISQMLTYPIQREYPIPPIRNATEFIERFDEVFDSARISNIKHAFTTFWDFRHGTSLAQEEESWFDYILCFNVENDGSPYIYLIECSKTEAKKAKRLIELERKELHESLQSFLYPVVLMETPTQLIRIDRIVEKDTVIENSELKNGYRLACWKKGCSISDKPDLILTNGIQFLPASWLFPQYDFINGNYGYSCSLDLWDQSVISVTVYENAKVYDDMSGISGNKISQWEYDDIQIVFWSERSKSR